LSPDVVDVELGPYRVAVATGFGPRVTGLRLGDGPEMLAILGPDVVVDHPDSDVFRLHGGHRLWAAPEIPMITYAGDEKPCEVHVDAGTVTITGAGDDAGLSKQVVVRPEGGRLEVVHTIANIGEAAIELAPWAITQVPLGGLAILPLGGVPDTKGLTADRSLVLWPYTDLSDRRLTFRADAMIIDASPGSALKLGSGPRPGRLGYLEQGHLFIKQIPTAAEGELADRGAVGQVYVNDVFCELESLGPITRLEPGASVTHTEWWSIEECTDAEAALDLLTGDPAT
jgi:hypothetical protein